MARLPSSLSVASLTWLLLALSGCAPTLSTFTPAHVAPTKHVQAELGSDVSYPTGTLDRLIDSTDALASVAENRELTDDERNRLLRGLTSTVLNPPSFNTHLGVGVGIYRNVEVQGRLFTGGWRLGSRYQFLDQKTRGVDLSAGIGFSKYGFALGIPEVPSILDVEDYSRWLIDVPILVGKKADWYRWWVGPKFLVGGFDASVTLSVPTEDTSYVFAMDGTSWYFGAQGGVALGYKWLFVAAELTVMRVSTSARFTAAEFARYEPELNGTIVYPGLGLMGQF